MLGAEIDGALPVAYATVFIILVGMQYFVRHRVTEIYLDSQRWNNRVTAHGYTAWDNVFSGNKYNLHLWFKGFKFRARECLKAAIRVIVAREGLSAAGAIIGLTIVFSTLTYIAFRDAGDTAILIGLAATLPRQIDMTNEVHQLAIEYNDVLASWTRVGGIADNMHPEPDPNFNRRIKFDKLVLREGGEIQTVTSVDEAMKLLLSAPSGRVNVRGGNGSGKSTLLAALKSEIKNRAYYWPTSDRLAFEFAQKEPDPGEDENPEEAEAERPQAQGFLVRRAADQVAGRDRAAHRCADLSARRMGRQSRCQESCRRECAGRGTGRPRPRDRNLAPRRGMRTRRLVWLGNCRGTYDLGMVAFIDARRGSRGRHRARPGAGRDEPPSHGWVGSAALTGERA